MSNTSNQFTGSVKFFKKDKGYGFIINDHDGAETFFHIKDCTVNDIQKEERVSFNIKDGKKGPSADNVMVL